MSRRTGSCSAGTSPRSGRSSPTSRRRARWRFASSPRPLSAHVSNSSTATSTATARAGRASAARSTPRAAGRSTCRDSPSASRTERSRLVSLRRPQAGRAEMQPTHEPKERHMDEDHPVRFSVEYPDRPLDRLTTAFRIFTVIPIGIVLASIGGFTGGGGGYDGGGAPTIAIGGSGLLFLPPLLMIVFREKYPRWWFDWNLELLRFTNRVCTYLVLMSDRYPSTDERQWVQLDFPYPDVRGDLNRWLPLVKWLLAIPHYIVLFFLYIATIIVVICAWFAILFTGRYPRGIFEFVEGVIRWHNRVVGYAFILVTDRYPPFSMSQREIQPQG